MSTPSPVAPDANGRPHRWRRYPKYKPSGVEWLGEVPDGWVIGRLKFYCKINPSKSEIVHFPDEMEVSFLPMENIGEDHNLRLDTIKPLSEVWNGYTYFQEDDVILAKITPCFENGKCSHCVGLNNKIGFGTTELHVLRSTNSVSPKFCYYLIQSHAFKEIGSHLMSGTAGQKRLPDDFVKDYKQGIPPLHEQTAIAAFLDRETARIDALLERKGRQIELLQEKRAALISHVVTKGLDPSVQMKESGVDWLGMVPEHWNVNRIKWVAKLESGHTPNKQSEEYWKDCTIPWVSLNDTSYLKNHDYIEETAQQISELGMANSSAHLLPSRAVIFTRDATIGLAAITTRPMAVSQHIIAWICGPKLYPEYLLFVFYAMIQDLERLTMGSTIKTIGMSDVFELITPLPPTEEQQKISDYIFDQKEKIDHITMKIQESIALLRGYRSALISAAVTGKIDVRQEAKA